jgi:AraC-like DNA-binding protein
MHKTFGHNFFSKLPVEPDAVRWGMQVVDMGYTEVPPHAAYPPRAHPDAPQFTWKRGRVLDYYQMVFISRGRGVFETKPTGRVRIEAGHVFLLFPGVRHHYRPIKQIGWDEQWVGIQGPYAERLMKGFFSPDRAVLRVGANEDLVRLMRSFQEVLLDAPQGYQQIMAGRAVELVARIRSLAASYHADVRALHQKIQRARMTLGEHATTPLDLARLAEDLGMSYSRFRLAFKKEIGLSPRQYHIEVRLNHARELLRNHELSVSEVADRLGFSSVFYFSRLFKEKTSLSPLAWRNKD